jgi:diguanylate cyclase
MENDANAELLEQAEQQKSLAKVLVQNEEIKVLVEQSAEELLSANAEIKQELVNQGSLPELENALEKTEAVEAKVQDASDKLSVVNMALKVEIKERDVLEDKLAAVTEQGRVDLHSALHDPLTGLLNRVLFHDRLEHGFEHAKRYGWRLALMFLDLDDFKIVNDVHGHHVGDSVLRMVAERLEECTRGEDTVSRLGGDEFVILITEVRDETNISLIAEKIVKRIQAPWNIVSGDLTLSRTIKASIGISIFPENGTSAETLIKSADAAMYEAKRSKSTYSFAR